MSAAIKSENLLHQISKRLNDDGHTGHLLSCKVIDLEKNKSGQFEMRHTQHSKRRAAQRGIEDDVLMLAVTYGEAIYKQGLVFYAVKERDLPPGLDHELVSKLAKLIVVTNQDSGEIITCYRHNKNLRYIKRKHCRLVRS